MNIKNTNTHSIKKNSKSFYFASLFLKKKTFIKAAQLYEFCRYIDDIADSDKKNSSKRELLISIKNQLEKKIKIKSKRVKDIEVFFKENKLSLNHFLELINGVTDDTFRVRIKNEAELINYSYKVAGTVGLIMCKILGARHKHSYNFAIDLGIAFQLTNIARDITEDAKLGRVYLPQTWLKIEPSSILDLSEKNRIRLYSTTKKLLDLAEQYYNSAISGLSYLPHRSRISVLIALKVYRAIGLKIKNNDYNSIDNRAVVSFKEKILVAFTMVIIYLFYKKVHNITSKHNNDLHSLLNKS